MNKKTVVVLGAGNIGTLISFLFSLHDDYEVFLASKDLNYDDYKFLSENNVHLKNLDVTVEENLRPYLVNVHAHAVVSALPYSCNKLVATVAAQNDIHYYDLTEDLGVKNHLMGLAKNHKSVLMPQCGLAPGFINVIGHHLMKQFKEVHTAKLRVGALPQQVSNAFNYALTWSTNGLVNEYGNPCEAVVDGVFVDNLQPLEGVEKLLIDGVEYEAFNTSGGLGTLAETWNGNVQNLNYKTLRYPGHCEKIRFLMNDMQLNKHRELLEDMLEWSIPVTTQDVIVIYSAVSGITENGKFLEKSYVNKVFPQEIGGKGWTGIQVTTAAGACAAVDMTLEAAMGGRLGGFVHQEFIDAEDFLVNRFGMYYQM